jgi:hypothetical protein
MKHESTTKAICNKDFSGNSSILPRSNFGVGGQESSPQSLTAHSLGTLAFSAKEFSCRQTYHTENN